MSTACCTVYVFYLREILCQLLVALFMFSICKRSCVNCLLHCLCFLFMGDLVSTEYCAVYVFYL